MLARLLKLHFEGALVEAVMTVEPGVVVVAPRVAVVNPRVALVDTRAVEGEPRVVRATLGVFPSCFLLLWLGLCSLRTCLRRVFDVDGEEACGWVDSDGSMTQ